MKGTILYEGPSALSENATIVVIAIPSTDNSKTGPMIQTYIINGNISPVEAVQTGQDTSICGNCPHRGTPALPKTRSCYVLPFKGPAQVYKALHRGLYNNPRSVLPKGWPIRMGTYGDPAAPKDEDLWHALVHARGHTGYTHFPHQAPHLKTLCHASVESLHDSQQLQQEGWKTYRTTTTLESSFNELLCPASSTKPLHKRTTCANCLLCRGNTSKYNIVEPVHGAPHIKNNFRSRHHV